MPRTSSIRRFGSFAIVGLFMVGGMAQTGVYGQGQPSPQITVVPDAGLVEGQTVAVSGTGFQADQSVQLVECGAR